MQIQYDIQRSLKVNPPNYGEGMEWLDRNHAALKNLVTVDNGGISLNPRVKDLEDTDHEGLTFHNGVLYDKEVMVVEKRKDGRDELISGYGRCHYFDKRDIETYFVDYVKFEDDYWKALWKRRLNAGADHTSKGIPNTEGSILKGLSEARYAKSFHWQDDEEVRKALKFMTNGSKSREQIEKLLNKWRKTNHKDDNVRALDGPMAGRISEKMGLPHKGYCKDLSKPYFDRIGFNISRTDHIDVYMKRIIDLYDQYGKKVELYGFIQHVVVENLHNQRKTLHANWVKTIKWMNKHFSRRYKDIVEFKGFHAQLRTRNPADGGRPTERGIVDVDGNILIDLDESPHATLF